MEAVEVPSGVALSPRESDGDGCGPRASKHKWRLKLISIPHQLSAIHGDCWCHVARRRLQASPAKARRA